MAACSNGPGPAPQDEVESATAALTSSPPVSSFVVLAARSASFDDRSVVSGGNIGVGPGSGSVLNVATGGSDSQLAVGWDLLSQKIVLRDRARAGNLEVTQLDAPLATVGTRSPYVAPPLPPSPTPATAGTTPVTVEGGQSLALAPGQYAAVTVKGTLNLTGGLYQFQSLFIDNDAKVFAQAPATVRLVTGLSGADRVQMSPTSGSASRLTIEAAGTVDSSGNSIVLGNDAHFTALLIAGSGFRAGDRLIASGAIAARDVIAGHDVNLSLSAGFQCSTDASCEDGNACTTNVCVDGRCQTSPAGTPSCAASILVGTSEQPALGKGPLYTHRTDVTLIGQVKVPVGLASAQITVNGGNAVPLSPDSAGNFTLPLTLLRDVTSPSTTNVAKIVAVDVLGEATVLDFNIYVLAVAVPDEILVLFNPDSSAADRQQTLQTVGATLKKQLTGLIWLTAVPSGTAAQAIATLNPPSAKVRAAYPNVILTPTMVPNDPNIELQRSYLQAIRAFDAWDIETGSRDVVVAVVDSGVEAGLLMDWGNCPGSTPSINVFLNEAECCLHPPCSATERVNCMPGASNNPHSPTGLNGFTDCPKADLNGDGCPGVCGVDDDHDGFADMEDPDVKRLYSNGFDDDGDGLVDEQAIVNGQTIPCSQVKPGDLKNAPSNGDCDGAANDDDEDGYPDDCRGWNFGRFLLPECKPEQEKDSGNGTCLYKRSINHPNQPIDTEGFASGNSSHGARVAQIIGEPGNNCANHAGINFKTTILPLEAQRYFPPKGSEAGYLLPDLAATIEAYQYAAAKGAHIINSSFMMGDDAAFTAQFPQLANSKGLQLMTDLMDLTGTGSALHVVAASNSPANIDGWHLFPARADISNKLVVGGTDPKDDSIWISSAYGPLTVDLAAPAMDLLDGFGGTSGATPQVSGAAALLMSHFPMLRGQPEVVAQMLRATARPSATWSGKSKTGGVLDIAAALKQSLKPLLFRDASEKLVPSGDARPTTELAVLDLDYDGEADYVFEAQCSRTNVTGQPHLLVNQKGLLTDRTSTFLPQFTGSFCEAVAGDLDGDGRLDIVLPAFLPDGTEEQLQNRVLMGGANGVYTLSNLGSGAQLTRAVALCDIDSDGDLDVYFANVGKSNGVLATDQLLRNDGGGNFTDISAQALGFAKSSQSPHKVLCVDLDTPPADLCQGLQKFSCGLCANPTLSFDGLVKTGRILASEETSCRAVRALVKPEIIVAGAEGAATMLLRRDSSGVFRDQSCDLNLPLSDGTPMADDCISGVLVPGRQDQDVEAGDFNGDGAQDLIFISRRGNPNTLIFNNGSGVFTNVTSTNWTMAVDDARDIEVADFNRDGKLDAVVFRGDPNLMNPGQNTLYLNDGAGKLVALFPSGLGSQVDLTTAARATDLDGDGDQDLLLVRYGKPEKIFMNNKIP